MCGRARLVSYAIVLLFSSGVRADSCTTTPWSGMSGVPPLTEFTAGYLYLGTYPGYLYDGSNAVPADHDADGKAFAGSVLPRNAAGQVCHDSDCKIVFLSIGFSNNTIEFCGGRGIAGDPDDPAATQCPLPTATPPYLQTDSFIAKALGDARVNHATVVLVDGAQGGKTLGDWDPTVAGFAEYNRVRDQILVPSGLSPLQVQSIWLKNGNPTPTVSLATGGPGNPPDAIVAEQHMGNILRAVKAAYPNVQQVFISPRIYGGYANTASPPNDLNPEPYAFEIGFSIKWLVKSQIQQIRGAQPDANAGSLDYRHGAAPWVGWGPYLWANGPIPRGDGLAWLNSDLRGRSSSGGVDECTHPGTSGEAKVANLLLEFMTASPYTPWFLASSAACSIAGGSLRLDANKQTIGWSSNVASGPFDVAKGDLTVLSASGGNFSSAACYADDIATTATDDGSVPSAGEAFFYLARCDGSTWHDGTQAGNRDPSLTACP